MPETGLGVARLLETLEVTPSAGGKIAMVQAVVSCLAPVLPRFDDGRIDYTHSTVAPVVHCVVLAQGEMLVVRRSGQVGNHQGVWAGITGYIDSLQPLGQVIFAELAEEAGIRREDIAAVVFGLPYRSYDPAADTTWVVVPVRVDLARTATLRLNWENTDQRWVDPKRLGGMETLPGLDRVVRAALAATLDMTAVERAGR